MKINEIFYSLQGEGARVGEASIFIRLTGCDLTCGFCDTEFLSGKEMSNADLLTHIQRWPGRWIVWTGGEPTLQLTAETVEFFKLNGYQQAVETNGNNTPPSGLDWVVCSPKVAEHVLAKHFPNGVDELRYARHSGQPDVPRPSITAKRYFLSPLFKGNRPDQENIKHCTTLCLQNPQWKLSLQTHELTGIL